MPCVISLIPACGAKEPPKQRCSLTFLSLKINGEMPIRSFISDDYAAIIDIHNSQNIV
jgi:hypothetical protein